MKKVLVIIIGIVLCTCSACAYKTVSTLDEDKGAGDWGQGGKTATEQSSTDSVTQAPVKKEPGVFSVWVYEETAQDEVTIDIDGDVAKAKGGQFEVGTPAVGHQCYKYTSELGDIYEYRTVAGESNKVTYSGVARSYIGCNDREEKTGINLRIEGKCSVELNNHNIIVDCEDDEERRGKHINIVDPNSDSKLLQKYGVNITEQTTKRLSIKPTQEGLNIKGSEELGGAVIGFSELNENDYWGTDSKYDQDTFVYIDLVCNNVDIIMSGNTAEVYADVDGERTLVGKYPKEEIVEDEKSETK